MVTQAGFPKWAGAVVSRLQSWNSEISLQISQKIKGLIDPVFRALATVFEAACSLSSFIVTYWKNNKSLPVSADEVLDALNRGQVWIEWEGLKKERAEMFGMSIPEIEQLPEEKIIHTDKVLGGQAIATQGPTEKSSSDFWKQVLKQSGSVQIVMLTCHEDAQKEGYDYLPRQNIQNDSYMIAPLLERVVPIEKVRCQTFLVSHSTEKPRQIQHYRYSGWPDGGCVLPEHLARFVKIIYEGQPQSSSLIVHSSIRIGFTGVFLAVYGLYAKFKNGKLFADQLSSLVPNMIRELRESRYGVVQTQGQYQLIYDTLKVLIAESRGH